jgi:hypothetical protein
MQPERQFINNSSNFLTSISQLTSKLKVDKRYMHIEESEMTKIVDILSSQEERNILGYVPLIDGGRIIKTYQTVFAISNKIILR